MHGSMVKLVSLEHTILSCPINEYTVEDTKWETTNPALSIPMNCSKSKIVKDSVQVPRT